MCSYLYSNERFVCVKEKEARGRQAGRQEDRQTGRSVVGECVCMRERDSSPMRSDIADSPAVGLRLPCLSVEEIARLRNINKGLIEEIALFGSASDTAEEGGKLCVYVAQACAFMVKTAVAEAVLQNASGSDESGSGEVVVFVGTGVVVRFRREHGTAVRRRGRGHGAAAQRCSVAVNCG